MKIGCPCWCRDVDTVTAGLGVLAEQGVTEAELGLWVPQTYFDYRRADHVAGLVEALAGSPVRFRTIHTPFGPAVDFSMLEDEPHKRGIEAQAASLDLAKRIGADILVVHPSSGPITSDRERRLDRSRGVILELAREAEKVGVKLAIENLTAGELGRTWEECLWLIEQAESDNVGCCFDTGHANLTGKFLEEARQLLPVAVTTHLHDNHGQADEHSMFGCGNIDWPQFMEIYRETGGKALLMLECRLPDGVKWGEAVRQFLTAVDGKAGNFAD